MDEHIKEIYASLSETAFYILVCVRHANHGYWITTMVASMTNSQVEMVNLGYRLVRVSLPEFYQFDAAKSLELICRYRL